MAQYFRQKEELLYLCRGTRNSERSACCISRLDIFAKKRYSVPLSLHASVGQFRLLHLLAWGDRAIDLHARLFLMLQIRFHVSVMSCSFRLLSVTDSC